jgi:hypothetical protein
MSDLINAGELARITGIPRHKVKDLTVAGKITGVISSGGKRTMYDRAPVLLEIQALGIPLDPKDHASPRAKKTQEVPATAGPLDKALRAAERRFRQIVKMGAQVAAENGDADTELLLCRAYVRSGDVFAAVREELGS